VHVGVGRDEVFGVAAVTVPACVDRPRAEVLTAAPAVLARTVCSAEPGHPDPVPHGEPGDPLTGLDDLADDLVPGRHVGPLRRQITLREVQIGPADAAAQHPDQQFPTAGLRDRPVLKNQRSARHRTRLVYGPCTHETSIDARFQGPSHTGSRRLSGRT
jgi:hypothetical protein